MAFSRASRHDMEGTFERSRRQLWELSAHVTQLAAKGISHLVFLITNGPAEPKSTVGLRNRNQGKSNLGYSRKGQQSSWGVILGCAQAELFLNQGRGVGKFHIALSKISKLYRSVLSWFTKLAPEKTLNHWFVNLIHFGLGIQFLGRWIIFQRLAALICMWWKDHQSWNGGNCSISKQSNVVVPAKCLRFHLPECRGHTRSPHH